MARDPAKTKRRAAPQSDTPLEEDWIRAAREVLIKNGVAMIQINSLAHQLGVTRGGFYWRFRNRQDLLDQLLADWQHSNTRRFILALERSGSPEDRYNRMMRLIETRRFDADLDAAVRQWGKIDADVAAKVRDADLSRIEALEKLFFDAGHGPDMALIRARIVYYHHIGFEAVGLNEPPRGRKDLESAYHETLSGFSKDS